MTDFEGSIENIKKAWNKKPVTLASVIKVIRKKALKHSSTDAKTELNPRKPNGPDGRTGVLMDSLSAVLALCSRSASASSKYHPHEQKALANNPCLLPD